MSRFSVGEAVLLTGPMTTDHGVVLRPRGTCEEHGDETYQVGIYRGPMAGIQFEFCETVITKPNEPVDAPPLCGSCHGWGIPRVRSRASPYCDTCGGVGLALTAEQAASAPRMDRRWCRDA